MKGVPKDYNFEVLNKTTFEIERYKSLNDIAKAFNTNYYTVYELLKINNKDIKKHMGRKLSSLHSQIEIMPIA